MAKRIVKLSDVLNSDMIAFYYDHPVEFIQDIIFHGEKDEQGRKYELSDQQKQIALALATRDRVSVRSGRGIGKTIIVSMIILWYLCTRVRPRIMATAPTFKQLNENLWPELKRWLDKSLVKDCFTWTSKKLSLNEDSNFWFASCVTASTTESVQGAHRSRFLLIVDEASGISDDIYNTLAGSMTEEDNPILLVGNPTQTSGVFFETHNNPKLQKKWKTLKFSSEDSPFVKKDYIEEIRDRYGENSDVYRCHVLGEFPSGSPDSFIPLQDVERATLREVSDAGDIQIGVDVARFGDDLTAICCRKGNTVLPLITKEKTSIPEVIGLVLNTVKVLRKEYSYKDVIKICVDDSGVGGGVSDELILDRENNLEVVPINFGSKSPDDIHELMCSYLWGNFKANLPNIRLPRDEILIGELSNRRFKITKTGKIRIEPKDEYKREFKNSPDRADAVILSFCSRKNEQTVLKNFDHLNSNYVRDIHGYELSGGEKYCSIFYSKNKAFHILFSQWHNNKLYIYDELVTDDSVALISYKLKMSGPFFKIIGSDRMFNKTTDDISTEFRKYNIAVMENYLFDQYGSIQTLENLTNQYRLVIDKRCVKLIDQLRKWNLIKNTGQLEVDYGLAYSLCYIVSELKQKIENIVQIKQFDPYSGAKEKEIRLLNKKNIDKKYKYFYT